MNRSGTCLLIDFGSTYTKITAVDLENEEIVGWAQAHTTVDSDITIGLNKALLDLEKDCGFPADTIREKYACSSAAGGLKMAAIGLVPELTLEAARRAALGAGAKVVCSYGFDIDQDIVDEIEQAGCDIILLSGGTDGGDKKTIIHNAEMLARSGIGCPVLVAGNRSAASRVRSILQKGGKIVYASKNVLPTLDTVDTEPAQNIIRDIFIAHIIKAKGLDKAQSLVGKSIIPTPKASLQAAALLSEGTDREPGLGSMLVIEIGGATTNIHSVADNTPMTPQTLIRGLPEAKLKRTVEGDLGIRYNARTIYDLVGEEALRAGFDSIVHQGGDAFPDLRQYISKIHANVEHVPSSEGEYALDIALAKTAATMAMDRHAGTVRQEYSAAGETTVQYGKNLLDVQNILGTGGIFRHGRNPERILRAGLFDERKPWSLKPRAPRAFIDAGYILYGIGLLARDFPDQALRIAKKYLKRTDIWPAASEPVICPQVRKNDIRYKE